MKKQSKKYWERRQAQFMFEQMEKAEDTALQMSKVYDKAQAYLHKQSDKIFQRYQQQYYLTEDEAINILRRAKSTNLDDVIRAMRNGQQTNEIENVLAEMNSAAYASRIDTLRHIEQEIDVLMTQMYQQDEKRLTEHLRDISEPAYLNAINQIQERTNISFSFTQLDKAYVDDLLQTKWQKKHYSKAIWDNHAELGQTLKEEFLVNYLTGRSNSEMAKVISERFNVEKYKARRLVRTESTFVSAEMEAKGYEEAGIEEYEYVSVLDNRTSTLCRRHDGKIYKLKDRRAGVNYPPLHVFCRATTIAHISDEWLEVKNKSNILENHKELVYNKSMSNLDLMAKKQLFVIDNNIRIRATKISNSKYDLWVQDNTKKIRDTVINVTEVLDGLKDYKVPKIVFVKSNKFLGYAGYDNVNDILFISDKLHSDKQLQKELSNGYFAAKNIKDTIIHELVHKKHWDSAKRLYNKNKKLYSNIREAKDVLDSPLILYVKRQKNNDFRYVYNISKNADSAYNNRNINELVAEVIVSKDTIQDKILLKKVEEMLNYGSNGKTK